MISKAEQQLAFEKVYNKLNAAQKKAVDTIEGPVMTGPSMVSTAFFCAAFNLLYTFSKASCCSALLIMG